MVSGFEAFGAVAAAFELIGKTIKLIGRVLEIRSQLRNGSAWVACMEEELGSLRQALEGVQATPMLCTPAVTASVSTISERVQTLTGLLTKLLPPDPKISTFKRLKKAAAAKPIEARICHNLAALERTKTSLLIMMNTATLGSNGRSAGLPNGFGNGTGTEHTFAPSDGHDRQLALRPNRQSAQHLPYNDSKSSCTSTLHRMNNTNAPPFEGPHNASAATKPLQTSFRDITAEGLFHNIGAPAGITGPVTFDNVTTRGTGITVGIGQTNTGLLSLIQAMAPHTAGGKYVFPGMQPVYSASPSQHPESCPAGATAAGPGASAIPENAPHPKQLSCAGKTDTSE